jgi:hypothetical protein
MAYEITIRDGMLCITYTGTLDARDFTRLANELAKLEQELPVTPSRLSDLSSCDHIDLDFAAMMAFTANKRTSPPKNPIKSALVAANPTQYGFARMFSALEVHPDIEIQIFPDADAAWAWLAAS